MLRLKLPLLFNILGKTLQEKNAMFPNGVPSDCNDPYCEDVNGYPDLSTIDLTGFEGFFTGDPIGAYYDADGNCLNCPDGWKKPTNQNSPITWIDQIKNPHRNGAHSAALIRNKLPEALNRPPICNDQYCENPDDYPTDLITQLIEQGKYPTNLFGRRSPQGGGAAPATTFPAPLTPGFIEQNGKCDPIKPLQRKVKGMVKPMYVGYIKVCRLKLPKNECISINYCKTEYHGYGLRYEGCDRYEQCTVTIKKPCIPGWSCPPYPWAPTGGYSPGPPNPLVGGQRSGDAINPNFGSPHGPLINALAGGNF